MRVTKELRGRDQTKCLRDTRKGVTYLSIVQKKCVQYYPEKLEDPLYPGQNLSVSLISIMAYASYTIRKMSVRSVSELVTYKDVAS
jgi:hypothetical protein